MPVAGEQRNQRGQATFMREFYNVLGMSETMIEKTIAHVERPRRYNAGNIASLRRFAEGRATACTRDGRKSARRNTG